MVQPYSRKRYLLQCNITLEQFMLWKKSELRSILVGHWESDAGDNQPEERVVYVDTKVPAPYDRIIAQLLSEDEHAEEDHGHEAVRRQSYVRRVLNSFWEEIVSYEGGPAVFRSKILTPLLQRQIAGVEENYSPSVMESVSGSKDPPTIQQATMFYLRHDPCNPRWIQNIRRTMVHIPEARWHLGVLMGHNLVGDADAYNKVRANMDVLTAYAKAQAKAGNKDANHDTKYDEEGWEGDEDESVEPEVVPVFNDAEVQVIVDENLEDFFAPELERVVRIPSYSRRP